MGGSQSVERREAKRDCEGRWEKEAEERDGENVEGPGEKRGPAQVGLTRHPRRAGMYSRTAGPP